MPTSDAFIGGFQQVFKDVGTPPVLGQIVTSSQGAVGFSLQISVGTARWVMGDGAEVIGNSISHTYTDGAPFHEVRIEDIILANVISLGLAGESVTAFDTTPFTGLTALSIENNLLVTLDITALPNLTSLVCGSNPLTMLDLSLSPALASIACENTSLTALDISNNPLLKVMDVRNTSISPSGIDAIIIALDNFGLNSGGISYDGLNPTAASLAAYNSLIAKSWTISGPVPV